MYKCLLLLVIFLNVLSCISSINSSLQYVVETLSKKRAVLFSITDCKHCKKVQKMFKENNYKYSTIYLDKRDDGEEIQDIMEQLSGGRKCPRLFIRGEFKGEKKDIFELQESGKLEELMKKKI